jgi:hypothetical protein
MRLMYVQVIRTGVVQVMVVCWVFTPYSVMSRLAFILVSFVLLVCGYI